MTDPLEKFRDSPLLVMSLHGVHQCASVDVYRLSCKDGAANRTRLATFRQPAPLLTWREHDLAAFPLVDGQGVSPRSGIASTVLEQRKAGHLPSSIVEPKEASSLQLYGATEEMVCGGGAALVAEIVDLGAHADHLATRESGLTRELVLGSLNPQQRLMQYLSTGAPGASGGPVVVTGRDPLEIIGHHLGGYDDHPVSFALLFDAKNMAMPALAVLGKSWPSYREPRYPTGRPQALSDLQMREETERYLANLFTLTVEIGLPWAVSQPLVIPCAHSFRSLFAWELATWPSLQRTRSLGFHIGIGQECIPLNQRLVAPAGGPFESGRATYRSWALEGGLDLRLRRFDHAAIGLELNGAYRFGQVSGFLPEQIDASSSTVHAAPFVSLRIVPSLRARFLVGLRRDWLPSMSSRYTGVGGATEALPGLKAWGVYVAAAVEWQPRLLGFDAGDPSTFNAANPFPDAAAKDSSPAAVPEEPAAPGPGQPVQPLTPEPSPGDHT